MKAFPPALLVFPFLVTASQAGNVLLRSRQVEVDQSEVMVPDGYVDCPVADFCGDIWCLKANQFCCEEGYPCPDGYFCLGGGNACCPNGEDRVTCARRYDVELPREPASGGGKSPLPAPSPTFPEKTPAVLVTETSTTLMVETSTSTWARPYFPTSQTFGTDDAGGDAGGSRPTQGVGSSSSGGDSGGDSGGGRRGRTSAASREGRSAKLVMAAMLGMGAVGLVFWTADASSSHFFL